MLSDPRKKNQSVLQVWSRDHTTARRGFRDPVTANAQQGTLSEVLNGFPVVCFALYFCSPLFKIF